MLFSRADGQRISQSTSSTSFGAISFAPFKPISAPVSSLCFSAAATSKPFSLKTPLFESHAATTFAPSSATSRVIIDPALPNPCTATRAPFRSTPFTLQASRSAYNAPRAVASCRPCDPPSESGLPVTTPSSVCPCTFKNFLIAAVHSHRNRNDQLKLGIAKHVAHRFLPFQIISGPIELLIGYLKWIEFFLRGGSRGHNSSWLVK